MYNRLDSCVQFEEFPRDHVNQRRRVPVLLLPSFLVKVKHEIIHLCISHAHTLIHSPVSLVGVFRISCWLNCCSETLLGMTNSKQT